MMGQTPPLKASIDRDTLASMPKSHVSASASATAKDQPIQAGASIPADPRFINDSFDNIVSTIRDAAAEAMNPRIDPSTAAALSQQNLALQAQANQIEGRLAAEQPTMALQRDIELLGAQAQDYVQAVINAVENVGGGIQVAGLRGRAQPRKSARKLKLRGAPLTEEGRQKRMWVLYGVGAAVVVAGIGIFLVQKHVSAPVKKFGKLPGIIPAR